jgi:hypothetical protein
MARKRTNLIKVGGILAGFFTVLAAAGVALFFFLKDDTFSELPSFPVDSYLGGGNLWSYDDYRISGRVDNVIYRSRASNRTVASIQPLDSKVRLPVVIEPEPGAKGVQIEQVLELKVTLGPDGELLCREFKTRK